MTGGAKSFYRWSHRSAQVGKSRFREFRSAEFLGDITAVETPWRTFEGVLPRTGNPVHYIH